MTPEPAATTAPPRSDASLTYLLVLVAVLGLTAIGTLIWGLPVLTLAGLIGTPLVFVALVAVSRG